MMALVALLSTLMVSSLRYTSFKTVGVGRRSTRVAILIVASAGMLIYLYSQYVLLAITSFYILQGMLVRVASLFRTRVNTTQP